MRIPIFITLSLFAISSQAQWNTVYSDPSKNLVDIQFTSADTGYVLGDNSVNAFLLKTIDGGLTWTELTLPLSFANRLYFMNNDRGYVIAGGVPVKLLKTIDGGVTWTGEFLDSSFVVMDFGMFNDSMGFYMNNAGRLRQIVSSGDDYSYIADTCDGSDIEITDPFTGYIAGNNYVLKTTNSGVSWNTMPTGLTNDIYPFTFSFASNSKGYLSTRDVSGMGEIFITTNGAVSWTPVYNFEAVFIDSRNNNCLAVNDTGKVTLSVNNGSTWLDEGLPVSFMGIETFRTHVSPANEAFVINGYAGQIFKRGGELGVDNQENEIAVNVYPNPFSNVLNVRLPEHQDFEFVLLDVSGRVLFTHKNQNQLDVSGLPEGMYAMRVSGKNFSQTIPLAKQ
ncbi:MAG TPA: YCF48-related protein [Flavobacteriales bacterium]|nr:YCF48-related protein [Flavobacteriales bacterium]